MNRGILLLICVALALSACGPRESKVTFDGKTFRGAAKAVDKSDRRNFVATVKPVSRGFDAAREAIRYEGNRYCILNFGISDINWQIEPDADATEIPVSNDTMVLRGTCVE